MARAAIERSLDARNRSEAFDQQIADQTSQVDSLKAALQKLEGKLSDARLKSDVLIARHQRARSAGKAAEASLHLGDGAASSAWDRLNHKVNRMEALAGAHAELAGDAVDDQFALLEKGDQIERLLADLKRDKAG
jgi:phage shock protein A